MSDQASRIFDVNAITAGLPGEAVAYQQFLKVPALHCGVYRLQRGATDPQSPHTEDEIYHVLEGQARFRGAGGDEAIGPGSVLYVPAGATHSFVDIEETLVLLVVFASATA